MLCLQGSTSQVCSRGHLQVALWLHCGAGAGYGAEEGGRLSAGCSGSCLPVPGLCLLGWCCCQGSLNSACWLYGTSLLSTPSLLPSPLHASGTQQRQEHQLLLVRERSNRALLLKGDVPQLAERRLLIRLPHAVSSRADKKMGRCTAGTWQLFEESFKLVQMMQKSHWGLQHPLRVEWGAGGRMGREAHVWLFVVGDGFL